MKTRSLLTKERIQGELISLGLSEGDFVLIRANMGRIGKIDGGISAFVENLMEVINPNKGTLVSLSYTPSSFITEPTENETFTSDAKSYAGALPNYMLKQPNAYRSTHPTNSYVAIGRHAEELTASHTPECGAYDPVKTVVTENGICIVIGCVDSSPGFTTTHLVENELGIYKRIIFPKLNKAYYFDDSGNKLLFRRKDLGMCSDSFYKFYAHYVKEGKLRLGHVGNAFSISIDAGDAYNIDTEILSQNPRFNLCDSQACFICNARRWDRLHRLPTYAARKLLMSVKLLISS